VDLGDRYGVPQAVPVADDGPAESFPVAAAAASHTPQHRSTLFLDRVGSMTRAIWMDE